LGVGLAGTVLYLPRRCRQRVGGEKLLMEFRYTAAYACPMPSRLRDTPYGNFVASGSKVKDWL